MDLTCHSAGILGPALLAGMFLAGPARFLGQTVSSTHLRLPEPRRTSAVPLEAALAGRHSVRSFARTPLSREALGQLLWAAQGLNRPDGGRTAPSAGATYPLELLVLVGSAEDLPPGLYRYRPAAHALAPVDGRDRRKDLARAALGQDWMADAPAVVVVAAVPARTARRYGSRAERYVAIEVGHAAQNLCLQAAALGLGTVPVGAFADTEVEALLGLGPGEHPYLLLPVGRAR